MEQKTLCAIYYRVSTPAQDLKVQKGTLPAYVKRRGWKIYDTYEDDGRSGANIEGRPDFKRLLEDLQAEKFKVLVVYELSRVTRTESAKERGYIIDLLIKYKIILTDPMGMDIDPNTPMGERYLSDIWWMAKQERRTIAKRMTDGRSYAMHLGIPMFKGKIPGGRRFSVEKPDNWKLKTDPKTWTVHWEISNQALVDKIRRAGELMLKYHYGWRKAAEEAGVGWQKFRTCIMNGAGSTYTQKNACKVLSDKEEVFTFTIPKECRIFDDLTVEKIKNVAKENTGRKGAYGKYHDYLLSKVAYDERGYSLKKKTWVNANGNREHSYVIQGDRGKPKIPVNSILSRVFDDAVIKVLAQALSSPDLFRQGVQGKQGKKKKNEQAELLKDIKNLGRQIDALKTEKNNLMRSHAKGIYTDEEVQPMVEELRADEGRLQRQLNQKQAEANSIITPRLIEIKHQEIIRKYTPSGKAVPVPDLAKEVEQQRLKHHILNLSWEEKRGLVLSLFSGTDPDGRKYGVYLYKTEGYRRFEYEIYANLGFLAGGDITSLKQNTFYISRLEKKGIYGLWHARQYRSTPGEAGKGG